MKTLHGLLALLLFLGVVTGCAKKRGGIDVRPLEQSFATAETAIKADVQNAISALNKGHHSEALAYLNKVALRAKLTAEQQEAVKNTVREITDLMKKKAEQAAKQASDQVKKALEKK